MSASECIIILDFAENYTFMIQDAIQPFHFSNTQASIHPFVIYYKQDGTLKYKSLACISDMLQDDMHKGYRFQKAIIFNVVKKDLPQIEKVIYFSDGCSEQYKNQKHFANLLHHYCNYPLYIEWHSFAMSHGNNAHDSIGRTIKPIASYASLQGLGILIDNGDVYVKCMHPKGLLCFLNGL